MWKGEGSHAGRETYRAGNDARFRAYLRQVEDDRVRNVVEHVRVCLGINHDTQTERAFEELERIIQDHLEGRHTIPDDASNTFEILARQYQAIWDRFRQGERVTDKQYAMGMESRNRAAALYTKIGKRHRAEAMMGPAQYNYWRRNEV